MSKNWARKILLKSPQAVKGPAIRRLVSFPIAIDNGLRLKVAETQSELEQAFKLLHDAYVKENLMKTHPSGMRVTKYHALPSTTTLVALLNNEVVGTVSLVRQSAFGLPLQSIFSLDSIPIGSRPAEVSSLAIKNGLHKQRGKILFPLLKFMLHYSVDYFGVTHYVIAVNPKWIDFYRSLLLFKDLTKKPVESYDFVNGAPALGAILDLKWARTGYSQVYGRRKIEKNLYHFFFELERTGMEFPLRKKSLISDPVLSPEMMNYFFKIKTSVFENLSEMEKLVLRELYNSPGYLELIPEPTVIQIKSRKKKRLEAKLEGRLHLKTQDTPLRIEVQSVSEKGLGGIVIGEGKISKGPCTLLIDIESHRACVIEGRVIWAGGDSKFGFVIEKPSDDWSEFYSHIDNRLIIDDKNIKNKKIKIN